MQLNSLVFPAPTCSYTTEKLFKDLVYIPRDDSGNPSEAIPCLYLPYENDSKIVLFFHGNAEDVGIAYDILMEIRNCLKVSSLRLKSIGYNISNGVSWIRALLWID